MFVLILYHLHRSIYTHPSHLTFYGTSENVIHLSDIDETMSHIVLLSYEYYRSKTLPYPYTTNCVEYRDRGYESRAHAYDSCVVRETLTNFEQAPRSILAGIDSDYKYLPNYLTFNETFRLQYAKIEDYCVAITKNEECDRELYVARLVEARLEKGVEAYLGMVESGSPSIVVISVASIEAIDYVTYVLSCFSFWFAFSPLVFLTEGFAFNLLAKQIFRKTDSRCVHISKWTTKDAREFMVREMPGVLKEMANMNSNINADNS